MGGIFKIKIALFDVIKYKINVSQICNYVLNGPLILMVNPVKSSGF